MMQEQWQALAWLLGTLAVFALPFIPVWRELRHPGDIQPLHITRGVRQQGTHVLGAAQEWPLLKEVMDVAALARNSAGDIKIAARLPKLYAHHDASLIVCSAGRLRALSCEQTVYLEPRARVSDALFARRIYCLGKVRLPRLTEAQYLLYLAPGVRFTRLHARMVTTSVELGQESAQDVQERPVPKQREVHNGDWHIEPGTTLEGNHVVRGDWFCGSDVHIHGSIKVHGNAYVGERAVIDGNIFALQAIECAANVFITGHVSSQDQVHIGRHCQIGTAHKPVQVIGSTVVLGPEVRIFGGVSTMYGGTVTA